MPDTIDRVARAAAAERLLADPLLAEALDEFERTMVDKIAETPARDDDGRTRLAFGIQALRKVRKHLKLVIQAGKVAALNAANDVASDNKRRWPF